MKNGRNQRDDVTLGFILYRKNLLTSKWSAYIYQFEKLTKVAWNDKS